MILSKIIIIVITDYVNRRLGGYSSITQRIIKGASWVMIGTVISKILVFCATIFVVRILGKENYGQLGIIRSSIQMFISLSAFGMGTTATKYIAQYRSQNPSKAANVYVVANTFALLMSVTVSIILFFSAPYISYHMLNAPGLLNDIRLASVILFFSLIDGVQKETLAGFEDFRRIAVSSLYVGIMELLLLCLGAIFYGVQGAIIGYGMSYCFASIYNSYYIHIHLCNLGVGIWDTIKEVKIKDFNILYKFSLPVALTSWIDIPCLWYVKTYLVNKCGFEEMATYDVSDQWRSQVLFIPAIMSKVVLPMLSDSIANNDKNLTISTLKINLKINLGVTICCALLLSVFAPYVMNIYGSEYDNYTPLILLSFAGVVNSISNVCGTYIFSINRAWSILFINVLWALSLLLFSVLLVNFNYGAIGLAIAYLIASIVLTIPLIYKTYRVISCYC